MNKTTYILSSEDNYDEFTKDHPNKVKIKLEYEGEHITQHIEAFRIFLLANGWTEKVVDKYLMWDGDHD